MADKKNLGIFWGQNAFYLIECIKGQAEKIILVPFDTPIESEKDEEIPEGLRFTALLQKTLITHNIDTKTIDVGLPVQDLVFRSFIIPWMKPDEMHNVIEFEVTKYIPIKLENLSYTYHPITFTENNQKSIRILFVAIRKDILEKYVGILEHTGLQVRHIEPAPVSLNRLLTKHGFLSPKQSNAIIQIEDGGGKIIIVENDIVQFVRKFQMGVDPSDHVAFHSQLFNDLRVSFNFYSRQNTQGSVNKIAVVSLFELPELAGALTKEFNIPASVVPASGILKTDRIDDPGLLNAYGIALREKGTSTKYFDLSDFAIKTRQTGGKVFSKFEKYKTQAGVILACFFICAATVFLGNKMIIDYNNKITELKSEQVKYEFLDEKNLKKKTEEFQEKLENYQSIRYTSDILKYLTIIPELLPKGVWLNDISIRISDKNVATSRNRSASSVKSISQTELSMNGMIYHTIPNRQFSLANIFASRLKNDETFSKMFSNFDLNTGRSKIDVYTITTFSLTCN